MSSDGQQQPFIVIWLEKSTNINEENLQSRTKLCELFGFIQTFVNVDECVDYIINKHNTKIVLIISGLFERHIVLYMHDFPQVAAIYIYSTLENKVNHETWTIDYRKVN